MKSRMNNLARGAIDQTRHIGELAINALRQGTKQTATYVAGTKTPVRKAVTSGLRLNAISHKSVDKLVKQQLHAFEAAVDDGARRLEAAADAKNVRGLVGDQVARMPATRKRIVGEARKTMAILVDTSVELGGLVKETMTGFMPAKKAVRKPAKKKAAKKTARKARAKTVARKAPAQKKPVARTATSVVRPAAAVAGTVTRGPKAA